MLYAQHKVCREGNYIEYCTLNYTFTLRSHGRYTKYFSPAKKMLQAFDFNNCNIRGALHRPTLGCRPFPFPFGASVGVGVAFGVLGRTIGGAAAA